MSRACVRKALYKQLNPLQMLVIIAFLKDSRLQKRLLDTFSQSLTLSSFSLQSEKVVVPTPGRRRVTHAAGVRSLQYSFREAAGPGSSHRAPAEGPRSASHQGGASERAWAGRGRDTRVGRGLPGRAGPRLPGVPGAAGARG